MENAILMQVIYTIFLHGFYGGKLGLAVITGVKFFVLKHAFPYLDIRAYRYH